MRRDRKDWEVRADLALGTDSLNVLAEKLKEVTNPFPLPLAEELLSYIRLYQALENSAEAPPPSKVKEMLNEQATWFERISWQDGVKQLRMLSVDGEIPDGIRFTRTGSTLVRIAELLNSIPDALREDVARCEARTLNRKPDADPDAPISERRAGSRPADKRLLFLLFDLDRAYDRYLQESEAPGFSQRRRRYLTGCLEVAGLTWQKEQLRMAWRRMKDEVSTWNCAH